MKLAAVVLLVAVLASGCSLFPGIGGHGPKLVKMPDYSKEKTLGGPQTQLCDENNVVAYVQVKDNGGRVKAVVYYWFKRGDKGWEVDAKKPFIVIAPGRTKGTVLIYISTRLDGYAQHVYNNVDNYVKEWGNDPCDAVARIKGGKV